MIKNILTALAITALSTTLAFAQTSTGTGAGAGAAAGAGVAGSTTGTAGTTGTTGVGAGANGSAGTTTDTTANAGAAGTNGTTGDTSTTGNAGTVNKTITPRRADAKKMNVDDCTAMMHRVHSGADANFSDDEAQPYLGKMSSMKMSTKTNGKLTTDEFLAACQEGTFESMN